MQKAAGCSCSQPLLRATLLLLVTTARLLRQVVLQGSNGQQLVACSAPNTQKRKITSLVATLYINEWSGSGILLCQGGRSELRHAQRLTLERFSKQLLQAECAASSPGASGLEGVAPTLMLELSLNRGTRCFLTGENMLRPVPLAATPSRVVLLSAPRPCLLGEGLLVPHASC
jgi:hypothetical protein